MIDGRLQVGSKESGPPRWTDNARLILRGVRAKVLEDYFQPFPRIVCKWEAKDAWPSKMDTQGFVYDQFDYNQDNHKSFDIRSRDACWYEHWLARDSYFSRQPYQQLAGVLKSSGNPDGADRILYAAHNRELRAALNDRQVGQTVLLVWLKYTVGYGIGLGMFRVLGWVIAFTLIGMLILWPSRTAWGRWPNDRAWWPLWSFGASLDHLLPIVELNKEYSAFLMTRRARLKNWQVIYFGFHALFGYILASFLVAALAGLTQAR